MSRPKDGATRKTASGHIQKYNARLGRWQTQRGGLVGALKSLNLRSRVASEGKEGKELIKKNRQKLGIREEIDVTSKKYKDAVKSGNIDSTEGGSREEVDVTSTKFKQAVTNPKKYLETAKKNQNKNNNDNTKSESKSEAKDTGGVSDSDKAAWIARHNKRASRGGNSTAAKLKEAGFKPEKLWELQKKQREKKATKLKIKKDKNKKNGG